MPRPTSVLAFVLPSYVGRWRLLACSLSQSRLTFVRVALALLSFSLLAVDVVRLSVCVLPRKNSDYCCSAAEIQQRHNAASHNGSRKGDGDGNGNESVALAPFGLALR